MDRDGLQIGASFEAADDLLWQAAAGRLQNRGTVTLSRSGRVGPLVELAMAMAVRPAAYRRVVVEPPLFHQLIRAFAEGAISGEGARDRAGVFPMARFDPNLDGAERPLWEQWAKHAENAAIKEGLTRGWWPGFWALLAS